MTCLDWMNRNGWFAWCQETVGAGGSQRAKRFTRFAIPGVPDAGAIKDGVMILIEFKRPGGKQSESQKAFETAYVRKGGKYLLVRSLEELQEKVGAIWSLSR